MSNEQKKKKRYQSGMSGARHMEASEKAKDLKGTYKKLFAYMKPYRKTLIIITIFALLATIFQILGPKMLGNATTMIVTGLKNKYSANGGIDFTALTNLLTKLAIIYGIAMLANAIQGWLMVNISESVSYELRNKLEDKIHRLPLSYFDHESYGDVLSRITNDAQTMSQSLAQIIQQILVGIVTIIGILYMMLSISYKMTLMSLVIVPVFGFAMAKLVKHSQKFFTTQQESLGDVNGHIEEMYGGHLVMKAYGGEQASIETFDTLNKNLEESAWKAQFFSGIMWPMSRVIGNLGYIAVCILGGALAIKGELSIGDIQAFIQYLRNFTQPITAIAQMANVLQATGAAAERVFEFLEQDEIKEDPKNPINIYDENGNIDIKGDVDFNNVSFGYNKDEMVIHNFNAHIKAGSKVAIVGKTGAGKTTLVKLLMRFYPVNDGAILVDGHNIEDFKAYDLRDCFGMVLQDAWLHSGTIMDNIRYGNINASDEDVMKAADAAYVDHFIRTLEDGYNTVIDEDASNISQGQKQLLTIARAFLKDPKILILDEATSSVDTRTEILIQKGMNKLMENRTSFIIAHRLSTIRNADMILVMDQGEIVEVGNHEELLLKEGHYASLYNSQFENGTSL